MSIQTTLINAAALELDDAYVSAQVESQLLPAGPNSSAIYMPGAANWGPVGKVLSFSDYDSGVPFYGDTQIELSSAGVDYGIMARTFLAAGAAAGGITIGASRVTDGTDTAAIGDLYDSTNPTHVLIIKLVALCTGSFGNRIGWQLSLQSGTAESYGVYRLTIFPPVGRPEVFSNIVGYTTGGVFNGPIFNANLIALVNGTNNTPPSNWVMASSLTTTTNPPQTTNSPTLLIDGTDGNAGLTDASIVGTDGPAGTRSGMYIFRNIAAAGIVILPGVGTTSEAGFATFDELASFVTQESCRGVWSGYPIGQDTADVVADVEQNGLQFWAVMNVMSWVEFTDPATGVQRWLEPAAEAAGVWASCPPIGNGAYPGNKPATGLTNIIATEDTLSGVPLSTAEGGEREANGIDWIGRPIPAGNVFGLRHGMMSDGQTYASDVSALWVIALNVQAILRQFVGQMQGTSQNDPTRVAARAKVNEYMSTLTGQINAYSDVLDSTNNTPVTINQGIMLCNLSVQTLTPVRFAIAAVQVGAGVEVTVSPAS